MGNDVLRLSDRLSRVVLFVIAGAIVLWQSCSKSGQPVQPPAVPVIVSFTAAPSDIMPGGNTTLSWEVRNTDSLVVTPGDLRFSSVVTGHQVSPAIPTEYTLTAKNAAGTATAKLWVTMTGAMPVIVSFEASPDTIVIDNQLQLSWQTLRTDSVTIAGVGTIDPSIESSRPVQPTISRTYQAVAYNEIGRDTATLAVWVEDPSAIQSPGGAYVRTPLGFGATETADITLYVVDSLSRVLRKAPIHCELIEGDGSFPQIVGDSLLPDPNGAITLSYSFTGTMPNALIRVTAHTATPIDLQVRRNVLVFGQQAQYVRFTDMWGTVKAFNGPPASVDPDPIYWQFYGNYETALGVIPIVADIEHDNVAQDTEPILGCIVNTVYLGRTPEGIGIGSTAAELTTAYGPPDTLRFDPRPPAAWAYMYNSLSTVFFTDTVSARPIIEIHMFPFAGPGAATTQTPLLGRTYRR